MKWINVNDSTTSDNYELWDADKKIAAISFSHATRMARIASTLGKRLFSFEKKGWFAPRAVFKNEYGVKLGKLELDKSGAQNGILEIEDKKYRYTFNAAKSDELNVYDENMKKTLLTCSVPGIKNTFTNTASFFDTKLPALLLTLCWYRFHGNNAVLQ
jgi:hypothetical protein